MQVEGLLDHLYLFRALKGMYLRAGIQRTAGEQRTTPRVDLGNYRQNLTSWVGEARARGVHPAFVALPRRRAAGDPPFESAYARALGELARELDVPLLNVPELQAESEASAQGNTTDFIDTLHFSPLGAARMANGLAEGLRRAGLVP